MQSRSWHRALALLLAASMIPSADAATSCSLLMKAGRAPREALANLQTKVARWRVQGKLKNFDFAMYEKMRSAFEADPLLRPTYGIVEEDFALVEAQYRRMFPETDFSIEKILAGDDWIRKRRLYKVIEGSQFSGGRTRRSLKNMFRELQLIQGGSNVTLRDLLSAGRGGKISKSLRIEFEARTARAGLERTLQDAGLIKDPTLWGYAIDVFNSPHTAFALNLLANVNMVFPTYHTLVGRLPHVPFFNISDDVFRKMVLHGDASGEGWRAFEAKYRGRYTRGQVYAAVSSVVMTLTLSTLIYKYVQKKNAEDADLKKKSDESLQAERQRTIAIAAETAAEQERTPLDDVMDAWAADYEKEHGALPDTASLDYRRAKDRFAKLFEPTAEEEE